MLAQKLLSGGAETLYVDDVFQAVTRTGTGASATITTGFQPDLIWVKSRSNAYNNYLADSARGITHYLSSNTTGAEDFAAVVTDMVASVSTTGYTMGSGATLNGTNNSGQNHVDWAWKKAPKFFDVVTYTGNGVAGRQIAHSLGVAPGFLTIKATNQISDWHTYHRSLGNDYILNLNNTVAAFNEAAIWGTGHTSTTFDVTNRNTNGFQYVAYLFAHDTSTDGIIQCGSFTTDGSGNATVNLGWEPQYLMVKNIATSSWWIQDAIRPFSHSGTSFLQADSSASETAAFANERLFPIANGFQYANAPLSPSSTYIYLAIRRSNKPPTLGTQVYNAIARTGTGSATTVTGVGFAPDLVMYKGRNYSTNLCLEDRLRGATNYLCTAATGAENQFGASTMLTSFVQDGFTIGTDNFGAINTTGQTYINHFFKRAPGCFDQVCYTGDDASSRNVSHSLGVIPELVIYKCRSNTSTSWHVYAASLGVTKSIFLNTTAAEATNTSLGAADWGTATSTTFSADVAAVNQSPRTYTTYLFASKAGISKVGSYTGNGSSQTIDCGFTTGARFILIRRTDSAANWFVFDTARGIVAGNDPSLKLNTTDAENTGKDVIDPDNVGFIVNHDAVNTDVNTLSGNYIFLAFA